MAQEADVQALESLLQRERKREQSLRSLRRSVRRLPIYILLMVGTVILGLPLAWYTFGPDVDWALGALAHDVRPAVVG